MIIQTIHTVHHLYGRSRSVCSLYLICDSRCSYLNGSKVVLMSRPSCSLSSEGPKPYVQRQSTGLVQFRAHVIISYVMLPSSVNGKLLQILRLHFLQTSFLFRLGENIANCSLPKFLREEFFVLWTWVGT